MRMIDKVICWKRPDGSVIFTYTIDKSNPKGTSEDDFLNRVVNKKIESRPIYGTYAWSIITKNDIRDLNLGNGERKNRNKVRLKLGALIKDETVKTSIELREDLKQSIRNKLKSGQPLTDDEIGLLIK